MNGNDNAVYQGSVGAKSWNEPTNPVGLKGWTHTSDRTALDLTENASLTVTVARQSGVIYNPPNGGPPIVEGNLGANLDDIRAWRCVTCGELIDAVIMHNRSRPKPHRVRRRDSTPRHPVFKDSEWEWPVWR